jgi:hypothetical protein
MGLKTQTFAGSAPCWATENNNHTCRRNSEGPVARGCLQGGVLSPLLWSLVVNELTEGLNENGCHIMEYSDDSDILITRKFWNSVQELLQDAFSMVQQWCSRTQLNINPQEMVIVLFTRKRDLRGLKKLTLSGHKFQLITDIKYLGLTLYKGLTQKEQLENMLNIW